jgi:hypothetical protein
MNLQLIFSIHEMEDFLKKLGYEIKSENEIDGVITSAGQLPEPRFFSKMEKHKYASKDGANAGRLESVFWQELKKKLLDL